MVKVVTDSTCDIPAEIASQLGITVVPLRIQIGNEAYPDGIGLDSDRVYHELVHGRELPKTSAPSPGDFVRVYNDLAAVTGEVVSIHLSPGYSGTCDVARLASSYVSDRCRVEVVDSNSVSVGLGLVVVAVARAAREGKNLRQIIDMIRQLVPRVHLFGKVDNFSYLFRGKRFRLSRGLILLGKISMALGIKLLGEAYGGGKIRSPRLVIGRAMALDCLKHWAEKVSSVKEVAIAYSATLDEAEMLAQRLGALVPREHMLITRLGCVTSTYIGPGTLAMALIGGKEA